MQAGIRGRQARSQVQSRSVAASEAAAAQSAAATRVQAGVRGRQARSKMLLDKYEKQKAISKNQRK